MAPSNSGVVILVPVLPISKTFFKKNSEIKEVLCHYISFYVMLSSCAMESTCVFVCVVYACLLVHVCLQMPWCLCMLRSEVDVYPHCSVIWPSQRALWKHWLTGHDSGQQKEKSEIQSKLPDFDDPVLSNMLYWQHTLEALFSCGDKSVRPIPWIKWPCINVIVSSEFVFLSIAVTTLLRKKIQNAHKIQWAE